MSSPHEHKLVPLKTIQDDYIIYWCRDCGMVCEIIGSKIYEMVPDWSKDRLFTEDRSKEKFKFMSDRVVIKQDKRLGRGLKDIESLPAAFLTKLIIK